jgi:hypothetical protein
MTNKSGYYLFCALQVCISYLLCGQVYGQAARERADTIITGTVVTMDGERHIYDDGAVAVSGDTIVAVGPRAGIEERYEGRTNH